jgi:hypothetical protein
MSYVTYAVIIVAEVMVCLLAMLAYFEEDQQKKRLLWKEAAKAFIQFSILVAALVWLY